MKRRKGAQPAVSEISDEDIFLFHNGSHEALWRLFGAHVRNGGVTFSVWAPNARSVSVVGDFNDWSASAHPMQRRGSSGIWQGFVEEAGEGALYKFRIETPRHQYILKTDPFAFATEPPPGTASKVFRSSYEWGDGEWIEKRSFSDPLYLPISIYECHLGSWRRGEGGRWLSYEEIAGQLSAYILDMGFTHVELLPVMEHPFTGSWGYQVSHYFAPTARFGDADGLRHLIDVLHQSGIGVILDWVPAHFPKDEFALSRFDGTSLYEHEDPRRGEHPDWGTLIFDVGRPEVRNFLEASATFWLEEFHADGLRVDAVASMLYLDYSRKPGEWLPNRFGGRENLDAVDFFKNLNVRIYRRFPGTATMAEESTAWPAVSRPVFMGGLGFGFKWNLGWMNDTLRYFSRDPTHRKFHHNDLTFGLLYAWNENFVLPLSHDEVVHMKGSLIGKMPGDRWQKFANLRSLFGLQWAHPGKQLLFMGGEVAQEEEWNHDSVVPWDLTRLPEHAGVQDYVRDLNRIYRSEPALWSADFAPEGFQWIQVEDAAANVLAFARFDSSRRRMVAILANLAPVPRNDYRMTLPKTGRWEVLLNSDDSRFGGSGAPLRIEHERDGLFKFDLPPLAVIWLQPLDQEGV